jgi:putative endonuclease
VAPSARVPARHPFPAGEREVSAQRWWFLYVLRCRDGSLYTGIARDVAARIAAHEAGKGARYTRGRGPLVLLAKRRCATHGDALRLELAVKRLSRAEKEALIAKKRLGAFARRLLAANRPRRVDFVK